MRPAVPSVIAARRIVVVAALLFAAATGYGTTPGWPGAPRELARLTPADSDWRTDGPRAEIAPSFKLEPQAGKAGGPARAISAAKLADFGTWRTVIRDVKPNATYCFVAWFRTHAVEQPQRSVIARPEWLDAAGKVIRFSIRPPEYPAEVAKVDAWSVMNSIVSPPPGAVALDVQLSLGFTERGAVWFDDIYLAEIDPPRDRLVRVMTVHHRARGNKSAAENVATYSRLIRDAATQKPDIICLPEGMTVVGTGKKYFDVGEPVPGPTTETLGQLARELRTYIVAGLYERVAPALYNTAVLIDREGRLAGTYRKTHLPREEWEAGLTPGDSYPIFQTDFGKIGILVCWDVQFPEPWRAVALQGAELVLLPIWGGNETLLRARAIENHLFAVSSSYDMKSCVVAPNGEILADAQTHGPVATAEINLDRKIYQPWLGDMSTRTWKERRPDIPIEPTVEK